MPSPARASISISYVYTNEDEDEQAKSNEEDLKDRLKGMYSLPFISKLFGSRYSSS